MSTFTYLIANNVGKLRLAISDIDLTTTTGVRSTWTALFTDEELGVFLSDASNNIYDAASRALYTVAASRSLLAKSRTLGDFSENLSTLADSIRAQAKVYAEKAESDPCGLAAEVAQTDFTYRDILNNYDLRTG
uniref:Uncharacterized protein n=1 Tax=viral metagenome TaxID=1070528 RepID=A0A6M3KUB1_9ZZZZ